MKEHKGKGKDRNRENRKCISEQSFGGVWCRGVC